MDLDKLHSSEDFKKAIEQIRAQRSDFSDSLGLEIEDNKKLLDCRHEIVFTLIANVIEQNDEGQAVASKHICKKNYHIPVPATKDYNTYMTAFFDFLEKCIANSAQQANPIQEDNNE